MTPLHPPKLAEARLRSPPAPGAVRVHELEQEMIPDSFLQGMQEAMRGELIDMDEAHFINPPLAA
jgi:hypothetical protein